jgi:ATP-binding cassette subfamily F protein 3
LFSDDDVDKKVAVLSGGEKSRLALLKILLHPANLLILDEPTNHLDINAKQVLLEALGSYGGTVLFVSHDTHFIKHIANRILYLSDDRPEMFEGDYEYFSWKLEQKEAIEPLYESSVNPPPVEKSESAVSRKETNRMKNRLRNLHKESEDLLLDIERIDGKVKQVMLDMSLEENYSDSMKITSLLSKKENLEHRHHEMEAQWFSLQDEIESLEAELGA